MIGFDSATRFPGSEEVLAGHDLRGRLAIVTGGSGGIGLATARALARAGAEVVVASRQGPKLDAAVDAVRAEASAPVHGLPVELSDIESVDRFADAVIALGRKVDFIVANAGVIGPFALSGVGIEMGLMTNVVGHAILFSRLSPHLADGARAVCLSSFGHHYAPFDFDDPNFQDRPYAAWISYGQSKTGCSLMAVRLSNALQDRAIQVFSVHPGAISTDMGRSMTADDHAFSRERTGSIDPADYKTPDQGAATTLWALTEPGLQGMGGAYLEDCHVAEIRDEPDYRSGVMRYAIDPIAADRMWVLIENLIGRSLPL